MFFCYRFYLWLGKRRQIYRLGCNHPLENRRLMCFQVLGQEFASAALSRAVAYKNDFLGTPSRTHWCTQVDIHSKKQRG